MQTPKTRILVTEDHADTREMISLVLGSEGFDVICVENAERAIEWAQTEQFDLYLLDNWMPGLSGIGLCEKLREFDAVTPILFYSSAAFEADKTRAFACGAQGYLTKPVEGDVLIASVRQLIADLKVA